MERYTIIIPTRDRCGTLGPAIRTCLEQDYANLRVIVSDNCSSDATPEVVSQFHASNLMYVRPESRLSMADHFEWALGYVEDGFVAFIGDDDGLLPDAVSYVARLQQQTGLLAISGSNAEYCWPDFPDPARANKLSWQTSKDRFEVRSSREWIKRCLSFQDIYTFEMPKIYHGFVHMQVVERARSNGRLFHSITPDAYAAFAIAFLVDQYVYSYRPFTIGGASGRSNGVSSMDAKGKDDEAKRFLAENTIEFHPALAWCTSLEVNMAEAYMKFAERFPELTAGYVPDWKLMLHSALDTANARTRPSIEQAVRVMAEQHHVELDEYSLRYQKLRGLRAFSRIMRVLRSRIDGERIADASTLGVTDVYDAARLIQRAINASKPAEYKIKESRT